MYRKSDATVEFLSSTSDRFGSDVKFDSPTHIEVNNPRILTSPWKSPSVNVSWISNFIKSPKWSINKINDVPRESVSNLNKSSFNTAVPTTEINIVVSPRHVERYSPSTHYARPDSIGLTSNKSYLVPTSSSADIKASHSSLLSAEKVNFSHKPNLSNNNNDVNPQSFGIGCLSPTSQDRAFRLQDMRTAQHSALLLSQQIRDQVKQIHNEVNSNASSLMKPSSITHKDTENNLVRVNVEVDHFRNNIENDLFQLSAPQEDQELSRKAPLQTFSFNNNQPLFCSTESRKLEVSPKISVTTINYNAEKATPTNFHAALNGAHNSNRSGQVVNLCNRNKEDLTKHSFQREADLRNISKAIDHSFNKVPVTHELFLSHHRSVPAMNAVNRVFQHQDVNTHTPSTQFYPKISTSPLDNSTTSIDHHINHILRKSNSERSQGNPTIDQNDILQNNFLDTKYPKYVSPSFRLSSKTAGDATFRNGISPPMHQQHAVTSYIPSLPSLPPVSMGVGPLRPLDLPQRPRTPPSHVASPPRAIVNIEATSAHTNSVTPPRRVPIFFDAFSPIPVEAVPSPTCLAVASPPRHASRGRMSVAASSSTASRAPLVLLDSSPSKNQVAEGDVHFGVSRVENRSTEDLMNRFESSLNDHQNSIATMLESLISKMMSSNYTHTTAKVKDEDTKDYNASNLINSNSNLQTIVSKHDHTTNVLSFPSKEEVEDGDGESSILGSKPQGLSQRGSRSILSTVNARPPSPTQVPSPYSPLPIGDATANSSLSPRTEVRSHALQAIGGNRDNYTKQKINIPSPDEIPSPVSLSLVASPVSKRRLAVSSRSPFRSTGQEASDSDPRSTDLQENQPCLVSKIVAPKNYLLDAHRLERLEHALATPTAVSMSLPPRRTEVRSYASGGGITNSSPLSSSLSSSRSRSSSLKESKISRKRISSICLSPCSQSRVPDLIESPPSSSPRGVSISSVDDRSHILYSPPLSPSHVRRLSFASPLLDDSDRISDSEEEVKDSIRPAATLHRLIAEHLKFTIEHNKDNSVQMNSTEVQIRNENNNLVPLFQHEIETTPDNKITDIQSFVSPYSHFITQIPNQLQLPQVVKAPSSSVTSLASPAPPHAMLSVREKEKYLSHLRKLTRALSVIRKRQSRRQRPILRLLPRLLAIPTVETDIVSFKDASANYSIALSPSRVSHACQASLSPMSPSIPPYQPQSPPQFSLVASPVRFSHSQNKHPAETEFQQSIETMEKISFGVQTEDRNLVSVHVSTEEPLLLAIGIQVDGPETRNSTCQTDLPFFPVDEVRKDEIISFLANIDNSPTDSQNKGITKIIKNKKIKKRNSKGGKYQVESSYHSSSPVTSISSLPAWEQSQTSSMSDTFYQEKNHNRSTHRTNKKTPTQTKAPLIIDSTKNEVQALQIPPYVHETDSFESSLTIINPEQWVGDSDFSEHDPLMTATASNSQNWLAMDPALNLLEIRDLEEQPMTNKVLSSNIMPSTQGKTASGLLASLRNPITTIEISTSSPSRLSHQILHPFGAQKKGDGGVSSPFHFASKNQLRAPLTCDTHSPLLRNTSHQSMSPLSMHYLSHQIFSHPSSQSPLQQHEIARVPVHSLSSNRPQEVQVSSSSPSCITMSSPALRHMHNHAPAATSLPLLSSPFYSKSLHSHSNALDGSLTQNLNYKSPISMNYHNSLAKPIGKNFEQMNYNSPTVIEVEVGQRNHSKFNNFSGQNCMSDSLTKTKNYSPRQEIVIESNRQPLSSPSSLVSLSPQSVMKRSPLPRISSSLHARLDFNSQGLNQSHVFNRNKNTGLTTLASNLTGGAPKIVEVIPASDSATGRITFKDGNEEGLNGDVFVTW